MNTFLHTHVLHNENDEKLDMGIHACAENMAHSSYIKHKILIGRIEGNVINLEQSVCQTFLYLRVQHYMLINEINMHISIFYNVFYSVHLNQKIYPFVQISLSKRIHS